MNYQPNETWPEVSIEELQRLLDTMDYHRMAFADAIIYRTRDDRDFAYERNEGRLMAPRYFVHPGLIDDARQK